MFRFFFSFQVLFWGQKLVNVWILNFSHICLVEIVCLESLSLSYFRPELLRPSQVVQPSPPNPPPVTSHPSGMATSVIRISPNPARGGPLATSTVAALQQQQHTSWQVECPGAPSYGEVTNQQPVNSFPSVVTSASQQQQQQQQQKQQHQQGLILQQALTSSADMNSSSQHHVEGPRAEHSQQHIRVVKPPPQQQNLTLMQMPKNEAIDCSGGSMSSTSGNTLYLVPHQSSPQEKKFVVIKSDGDLDKFPTTVMVNHIPAASSTGCLPQTVVVDKAPVSSTFYFELLALLNTAA